MMNGPGGIPPTKRQKIDSSASDTPDIGELLNDLPDEVLMAELKGDTSLLNAELNSIPQPPSNVQPASQQNAIQLQQGGMGVAGSGYGTQMPSNPNQTINMYTNSPQMNSLNFTGLNTSGSAPSPQPTSISTSADPTPVLPAISSTPAHSTPTTITTTTTSSPLQTSQSLQRTSTYSGMMHSSPSSLPQMATGVNSAPPNTMLPGGGHGPTMIHHGMSHTPNQHAMGNPHPAMGGLGHMQHAVMSSQRGVPHPGMTTNQYGMRQNPVGMGMGMTHGGMVSAQHGMRYPGMSSPQAVAPGTQMRMAGPSQRMGNPHLGHMAPHMASGMVRNPMMSGGMVPGQPVNHGMPMGSRQPPVMGDPQMMQGGLRQPLPSNPVGPPFQDSLLSSLDPTLRTSSDFGALGHQTVHTLPNQAATPPQAQPQPQQNDSSGFGSQPPSSAAQSSPLPSGAAASGSPQHQQQLSQQSSGSPLTGVQGSVAPTLPQSQPAPLQTAAPSQLSAGQLPGQLGPQPGPPMPPMSQQPGVGSPGPPGGQTSDPEKRKLIQQQLVLLLHAHKCQRRERDHQVGGAVDFRPCTLPHCRTMKGVLNHMTECQAGRSCTYPHCASSRQIITHWRNCQRPDCPVCLPLKHASLQHKRDNQPVGPSLMPGLPGRPMGPGQLIGGAPPQGMPMSQPRPPMMAAGQPHPGGPLGGLPPSGGQFSNHLGPASVSLPGDLNRPSSIPYSSQVPTPPTAGGMRPPDYFSQTAGAGGIPADLAQQSRMPYPLPIPNITGQPIRAQPWHQHVNPDLRQHLVRKLVEAIYPVSDPVALQDRRVTSLIQYAMKVEKAMFETATSREEYYQLLAEKIYRIRKELEQRRMMKSAMENKRQMGGLPGEPGMPNGEPMQPFFGGQQPGGDVRYSLPPTPLGSQAIPSAGSGSPKPPSSVDLALGSQPPFALPPTPTSGLDADKKKDVILNRQHSKLMSPTSVPLPPSQPPSDQKPFGGIPSVKNEVQSERSPAPPSVPKPLPDGSGTTELDQPFPSVPAVTTPSQFTVSSVKAPPSSVKGGDPFSEAPLNSSRPSTPGMEVEPGASPIVKKQSKIQPDPALRKVFVADELDFALRPVLEAVWNQDPESYPFRQPVDPKSLGIPDYFEIIRRPMDLGSMSRRLEEGEYKSPWEFCKDMWLMFDNAWLYNKKTSRVYKYCSKLSEVFDQYIDEAMKNLGYCCGRRFTFHPQVLYCYGKPLCTIPRDTCYYGHKNRFGKYVYCPKCFFEIPGDSISVGDDPMTATSIPKNAFKEQKNDSIDYEEMVECIHCGREVHKICVLHHDSIWPDGYQCNKCLKAKGVVRKESRFSAKRLPTTKLSSTLEERVNTFLRLQDADAGEITVRVVSSSDKTLDTRTNMKERFAGEFPEQFPYRTKAMFVFEEIDGSDVCFFGMHVQEYGSDCLAPNTRRVYISYLDSVHFFRPRHLRTQVYHELLIGYLQFCKDNGFLTAHIWACPPSEGDDYIFHCHPVEQKIPKPKRLVDWYKKMLDMGKAQGVVWDYQDIFKHCTDEGINSVTEIPYFEGDFWLNVIEETIKELDQEAREREASEQATCEGRGLKKAGKRSTNKKGNKKAGSTRSKSSKMSTRTLIGGDDLAQKIYQTMDKHKEVFFVVTLQPPAAVVSSPLPGTSDPDQLIQCDLMDGRDAFLTMARERHWEFSSLRRARYSTMAMLYELHNQSGDRFVYTCNHCRNHVETRFHCKECDDFDLCVVCYKEVGHVHPMEKLGLGLDDDTTGQDQRVTDPKEQRKAQIQKCIQFLIHASKCRDPACKQPSCVRMKRVLRHTRDCKLRMSGNCSICKQFLLLCYSHARTCTEDKCPVPVCARIKKTFREQQMQRRRQNERFIQQRMANMHQLSASNNGSSNSQHTPSPPVANTSPPSGSKIPTPPSKGSPAPAPAVSNPAAVAASPIAPRSVGKGGPRTPGKASTPQPPPASRMVVPPPASLQQAANNVPPAFSKPEQSTPAPNVTVSQSSGLNFSGEMPITRVPQLQPSVLGSQVQHVLAALRSSNPMDREKAIHFMKANPEVGNRVMHIARQQKEQREMMNISQDIVPHQPLPAGTYGQPLPHSGISQVPPQPNAMMMQNRSPQPMMYHQQVAPPQPTMMRQTMVPQHQAYHGAGGQQMPPHTLRPPPQYPSAHGPQTAGYPQVLGQQPRPMQSHSPMAQHMQAPMQHPGHTQYSHPQQYRMSHMQPAQRMVTHQTQMGQMYQNPQQSQLQQMLRQPAQQHPGPAGYQMGMDPGMQADPSFMYSQHQYGLNSSNNNNSLSQDFHGGLTPQDQLSRFVEKL